jgi:hypothetical protein
MADGNTILDRYLERTPNSARLCVQAREVLPRGIVTDTRFFEPYGIYIDRALGTRKWDVDGNEYLDLFGGHGAKLLGHSPPVLVNAVRERIGLGVQYAANQPLEIALAREVMRLLPTAERALHRIRHGSHDARPAVGQSVHRPTERGSSDLRATIMVGMILLSRAMQLSLTGVRPLASFRRLLLRPCCSVQTTRRASTAPSVRSRDPRIHHRAGRDALWHRPHLLVLLTPRQGDCTHRRRSLHTR